MSSVMAIVDPVCSEERGLYDIAALLHLEICSYLEVHDRRAMRNVCKRWRSHLSGAYLAQYVDLDFSKIKQSAKPRVPVVRGSPGIEYEAYCNIIEDFMEYALSQHLHKNTKLLMLRHAVFEGTQFRIVEKVIEQKRADLIHLILVDCTEDAGYGVPIDPVLNLIAVAGQLTLHNHTIRNVLRMDYRMLNYSWLVTDGMPCKIDWAERYRIGYYKKPLPIVLSHLEFDGRQWYDEQYHSFVKALEANCPEVSPQVRDDVVQLYNWWKQTDVEPDKWQWLGRLLIRSLNIPVGRLRNVANVTLQHPEAQPFDPRQLDPLTFNNLTIEGLHRVFCLPRQ